MFAGRRYRFGRQPERNGIATAAFATAVSILALTAISTATRAGEPPNPAHVLAEKFSQASDDARRSAGTPGTAQPTSSSPREAGNETDAQIRARAERERRAADEQRAYEEDMLARARAEAEARLKSDMEREQEAARQRAEAEEQARKAQAEELEQRQARERAAAVENARKVEQAERASEEARRRSEAERLARERENEARQLADRLRAARRAREEARVRAAAEAEAIAQADARLETARNALRQRTDRLASKLEEMKTRRERYAQPAPIPQMTGTTHRAAEAGDWQNAPPDEVRETQYAPATPASTADTYAHRATVLLVMKPGNKGIRRWNKVADPMLCVDASCYISNGADTAARRVTRRKGFGPGIALGMRAGACNNQLVCVFRDVDLTSDHAWMQPIDLRIVRHDRRESRRVGIDPTCSVSGGRLSCTRTVESDDYRAWIVPEALAQQAGAAALTAALDNRLQGNLMARSPLR